MTHRPIRTQPDGTRVYSNYTRYTPVPEGERRYQRRKPEDPRAVRWGGDWLLPLETLPEDSRELPVTRPDTVAYDHVGKPKPCRCDVCRRPESEVWKQRARDGLTLEPRAPRP